MIDIAYQRTRWEGQSGSILRYDRAPSLQMELLV